MADYNVSMAKKKDTQDRHASNFMVRLPDVYRKQLQLWQEKHFDEHRIKPSITDGVRLAVEDFLAGHELWPPTEPNAKDPS